MASPPAAIGNPPANADLIRDPTLKAQRVAANTLRQYDEVVHLAGLAGGVLNITPDLLRQLQRVAIGGIYVCAGEFRTWPIYIIPSPHTPPAWPEVPGLVDEMCRYANNPANGPAIHTAAYLMWRLNWIHPFGGGNGRTSRSVSYLALCVRLGFVLPGSPTILELIVQDKGPYYDALQSADAAWARRSVVNVSAMETYLSAILARRIRWSLQRRWRNPLGGS